MGCIRCLAPKPMKPMREGTSTPFTLDGEQQQNKIGDGRTVRLIEPNNNRTIEGQGGQAMTTTEEADELVYCAICNRPPGAKGYDKKLTISRHWSGAGVVPCWAIVHPGCDYRESRKAFVERLRRLRLNARQRSSTVSRTASKGSPVAIGIPFGLNATGAIVANVGTG